MMKTEEQAEGMWCPFAREIAFDGNETGVAAASCNRPFNPSIPITATASHCIASRCMAWRWSPVQMYHLPDGTMTSSPTEGGMEVDTGYCGLVPLAS